MRILNKLSFHKKIFLACLLTALVPLLCSSVVMIRLFTAALERQDLDEGRTQIIKADLFPFLLFQLYRADGHLHHKWKTDHSRMFPV